MSFTPDDISTLADVVTEERGEEALPHVDAYVNTLRTDGDEKSASLWSMVLAVLFHRNVSDD